MIYIEYKLFELYTMKVVRTVLSGGKFVKIYLSQLSHWGNIYIALNMFYIIIIIINIIILIYNKYIINIKIINKKEINNYIGPLNIDIISIIYGSILSNSYALKIKGGTKIIFQQENIHNDYLYYLHSLLANLGYCNTNLPIIKTKLNKKGKIIKYLNFETWKYKSFNYIFIDWYKKNKLNKNYIKVLPKSLNIYLTPLALAIWIIDNNCKFNKKLIFFINYFKYNDILFLKNLLYYKYNINTTIYNNNNNNNNNLNNTQYIIYVSKESIPLLNKIVSPYIIPSIKYKLNNYLVPGPGNGRRNHERSINI